MLICYVSGFFSDECSVVSLFSVVSTSAIDSRKDLSQNDLGLLCVEWDVKRYSASQLTH